MTTAIEPTKTTKGEQTRALILETALTLFTERGYEATTMRAIAERAGIALGSTYYYFRSKEQLIQAFYHRTHVEHLAACAPLLRGEQDFRSRLRVVMGSKLDTIAPYHQFAGVLFKSAADPDSPLNPFSAASQHVREESIALFAHAVHGGTTRLPQDLRDELPMLLWTYHMGILLFWIHDTSPNQRRTRRLTERSVDLIAQLVLVARTPLLAPIRRRIIALIKDLQRDMDDDA